MRIIDMHCDTVLENWRHPEKSMTDGDLSINLKLLREHHALAQFFAVYIPRKELETMDSMEIVTSAYACYKKMLDENPDIIRPAYGAKDILKNKEEGHISAVLTIEDGVFLEGKLERVDEAWDMGVRLITPLWNFETTVGYPNSDDPEVHMKGLKPFGFEFVEYMNYKKMMIDVSHLSEGGFFDVAAHSKAPFVASHSCSRTLCNHRRNLTDEQLCVLGDKGGFVGVNFEKSFLRENSKCATYDQIIEHLLYMKNKAGIESIGFGSDFDGIEDNGELVNYSGFDTLLDKMQKVFTADEIDKICTQNALRVIKDILGE